MHIEKHNFIAISDACIGYGSPQIPVTFRLLETIFSTTGLLINPFNVHTPPRNDLYPDIMIKSISTEGLNYTTLRGRARYIKSVAAILNKHRPKYILVFCTFSIPVLALLNYKPEFVVYYAIESIVQYGPLDVSINKALAHKIDFIIAVEENRARLDGFRCDLLKIPSVVILNSTNSINAPKPTNYKNNRLLHSGTIGVNHTYTNYFLSDEIRKVPIDVCGTLTDEISKNGFLSLPRNNKNLQYLGRLDISSLNNIRANYDYSICIWNNNVERGLYAPSNKFYEAIGSGVVPITAPHPQHVRVINKYNCGIVMDSWSFKSFKKAIHYAVSIMNTPKYDTLRENCELAVQNELSWERQSEVIEIQLKNAMQAKGLKI